MIGKTPLAAELNLDPAGIEQRPPVALRQPVDNDAGHVEYAPTIDAWRPLATKSHRLRDQLWQDVRTVAPLLLADVCFGVTALLASACIVGTVFPLMSETHLVRQFLALAVTIVLVFPCMGLYSACGINPIQELRQWVIASTVAFAWLLFANSLFGTQVNPSELWMLAGGWIIAVAGALPLRSVVRSQLGRLSWWGRPALVVGTGAHARSVLHSLRERPSSGLRPLGILDIDGSMPEPLRNTADYIGSLTQHGPAVVAGRKTSWAIIAMAGSPQAEIQRSINMCSKLLPNVVVISDFAGPTLWARLHDMGDGLGLHIQERLLLPLPQFSKRIADILCASLIGIFILPLLAVISVAILIVSPGPIFYSQERIGRHGKRFRMWKFRTMVPNAADLLKGYLDRHPELRDEWQRDHKLRRDPRILPVIGHLLRKLSLDELPQLWNVLIGDMSLVGPRPIVSAEIPKYGSTYYLYQAVRPGITGLWQISGRNNTTYSRRLNLDTFYIRNWSPWFDFYILVCTFKTVLLREGAF
ncbi:UDP-glucose:undecaprenyl-phosphate glucose-1-phosphate transferase [Planctomycetes bacterium Pan216]|uniref:UDP-glucose:undecaprenyl-phosphate glucose-1-phosphate transferase n=1 Tax=Kolteria novifilia TaxID=2527975 RepID=A0A518B8J6_9BACT|nr:UDP-glucose:undecaprenyl-phosphate glucose-1-phosphate transferase [Planctomycetes bacterium Pan216]